jgi:integrase
MDESTVTPTPTKKKPKPWSYSAGPYRHRCRVFLTPTAIYAEMRANTEDGIYKYISRSLGHKDKKAAIKYAHAEVDRWLKGEQQGRVQTPVLSRVFSLYLTHQTPTKADRHQKDDERRCEMWTRYLGAGKDLSKLSLREWSGFITDRRGGAINSRGQPVPPDQRTSVGDGSIWSDLVFLNSVLNWATKFRPESGEYLMQSNPWRGYKPPQEKNPKQPVVTPDRFAKIRAVADQVMMVVGSGKSQRSQPSYLPDLLDLVWGTGRRISAVLALRFEDLRLDVKPHGAVQWPASSDKTKKTWLAPLNAEVRGAINRILSERPGIGAAPLFPSPLDDSRPVSKELADKWLIEAEKLAGVPKMDGSLWHAYRRGWATSRKGVPLQDVMYLGGWTDPTCLTRIYQQADWETMVAAAEPRNAKQA